jgi:hypothetical protein
MARVTDGSRSARKRRCMKMTVILAVVGALGIPLVTAAIAQACTTDHTSQQWSAQTYAAEGSPTENFGTNSYWRIGRNPSNEKWFGYIKGTLPSAPAGCTVASAYLGIAPGDAIDSNGNAVAPANWASAGIPQITLKRVDAAWGENTLTWNNRPSATGVGTTGYPDSSTWWLPMPASSLQSVYSGSAPNDGWVLQGIDGSAGAFWRLLSGPHFVIVYWQ